MAEGRARAWEVVLCVGRHARMVAERARLFMSLVRQQAGYTVAASLVFIAAVAIPEVWQAFEISSHLPRPLGEVLRGVVMVAVAVLGVRGVHRLSMRGAAAELGLLAPVTAALLFAAVATSAVLICFAVTRPISEQRVAPSAHEVAGGSRGRSGLRHHSLHEPT